MMDYRHKDSLIRGQKIAELKDVLRSVLDALLYDSINTNVLSCTERLRPAADAAETGGEHRQRVAC